MWPKKRRTPLSFSPELYFKTQRAAEHQKKKEKKRGEYNNNKLEINFETRGGREEEAFKILCRTENSNTKEGKKGKIQSYKSSARVHTHNSAGISHTG